MKELNMLHISDIHLGTKEKAELYFVQLEADLRKGLHINNELDFLIISGDIANRAAPEEYDAAFLFVNKIKNRFKLDKSHIVIVPGNHDAGWDFSKDAYASSFIFREDLPPSVSEEECIPAGNVGVLHRSEQGYKKRFANFSAFFYERIFGNKYANEYEHQGILYPYEKYKILFLGLNSSWNIDHYYKSRSSINMSALSRALGILSGEEYEGWIKCIVFHHPVSGPDMIKNIDFMEQLAVNGFQILLHGHIHEAIEGYHKYDDKRGISIIGAGVFGAPTREYMVSGIPFQYNLLRYDSQKHTITVNTRKKEKEEGAWSSDARWVDKDNPQPRYIIDLSPKTKKSVFTARDMEKEAGPLLKVEGQEVRPQSPIHAQNIQGIVQAKHIEKINQYFAPQPERDFRLRYLAELVSETNNLHWASLDPDYADPKCGESLRLVDIYTALDTTEIERIETEDEVRKHLVRQEEARRLSAQEMINTHAKLVLLGDPGSGKSTLVNFLTFIMAEAGSGNDPERCLERLKKTGPWDHGVLFPVRILLRDFASELSGSPKEGRADLLLSHLQTVLGSKGLTGFWDEFHKGLLPSGGTYLILFDGLDEVPDPLHKTVVKSIDDFVKKYPHHRYLVTCRIYAYVGKDYQLGGFKQSTLTPFNQEQIESFISAWYHELSQRGRFTLKDAQERASRLKRVALRHDLRGLAERPLLMTVMALLHSFRGELPEDRVELYKQAVDLLLRRWEGRFGKEEGLIEMMDIPGLKINDLEEGLYDVAFYVHSGHTKGEETADISEATLRERLAVHLNDDWNKAGRFIEYVRERAGLLIRHKPSAYTFPHRTFQEYLAACHLVIGEKDYPSEASRLVNEEPDRWRIVFILAAGYAARNHMRGLAISSVNNLCPAGVEETEGADKMSFYRAEIAAEALLEIGLMGVKKDACGPITLKRVKNWLVAATKADEVLEPKERVAVGNILSKIGDPRFNPEYWYLPDDPHLGFVEVPAGPFMMGSDKKRDKDAFDTEYPQHEVTLSAYAIGRYPVTEAQFRAFVKDSGYNAWEEWERDLDNHPVVNISWDDAQAYCKWLTEKLKDRGWLIRLPTEAEWEKSARGTDGRIYPWGDIPDANKANYSNTGIYMTSPVGCFPGGASPYGISDMAGNVFEWCLDWFEKYPSYSVSDPEGPSGGSYRVHRGGSWIFYPGNCRSAFRGSDPPGYRSGGLGFRLVRSLP